MPYIKAEDYARAARTPKVPGELNYAITMKIVARMHGEMTCQMFDTEVRALVMEYLDRVGMSYTNGNAVMGVLDCASRELRRRTSASYNPHYNGIVITKIERELKRERKEVYDTLLAPYEDVKIAENGDVYPNDVLGGSCLVTPVV